MDSAKLNDWMQVVGIFAVVASLIFVGLQMQQDRVLATVEALSSRSDTILELTDMISTNRELWVSALNGDELSEADQATFQAMAESVESYFVSLWVRFRKIGGQGGTSQDPVANYSFALYSHKGLRQVWDRQLEYWRARDTAFNAAEGGSGFRNLISASLAQLDKDAPPLPEEKRYVFW